MFGQYYIVNVVHVCSYLIYTSKKKNHPRKSIIVEPNFLMRLNNVSLFIIFLYDLDYSFEIHHIAEVIKSFSCSLQALVRTSLMVF